MTVRIRKMAIFISGMLLAVCIAAVLLLHPAAAAGQITPDSSPGELFDAQSGMQVETNVSGTSLQDGQGTALFPDENRAGVKLTATQDGAEAGLNKVFSGSFEIDLRVWSDTTFNTGDAWLDFANVHTYDLRELQLIFEDEAGQTFTVHVSGGDAQNAVRTVARVSVSRGNDRYSYMYDNVSGAMTSYRANSYGTALYGTSFANLGRGFASWISAENTIPTTIGFDPAAMEVYGIGYATDNSTPTRYTVWSLDHELTNSNFSGPAPTEALRTLSSFGDYTVTLRFADIEEGRTAKAVVYSVNGQSLAGSDSFTEDSGPAVLLANMPLGTAGREADLTQAVTSINDFFEGSISSFTGTIDVLGPGGVTAQLDAESGYAYVPPQEGEYTLTYRAEDAAGNSGSASTITWTVLHADLEEGTAISSLWTADSTSVITSNVDSPSYAKPARGMLFTAETAGSSITYNNKIKLQAGTPFIKLMTIPSQYGSKDYDRIALTLTDAHDPNNVLHITLHSGSWGNEYTYLRAGANNMRIGGWNTDEKTMQYTETHGFVAMHSFTGESRTGGAEILSLYFDSDSLALNVSPTPHAEATTVIDFDDSRYLGGQSPWYGFTNDEVYISVSLTMFTGSDPAQLLITELNGQTLDGTYLYDTKAPSVAFDFGEYTEDTLPVAKVGSGYRLFPATAYDEADGDLTGKMTFAAYYGYGTDEQRELAVADGVVTPDAAGTVTVVYSVKDAFGNEAEALLEIEALAELEELGLEFAEDIPDAMWVGERFYLPPCEFSGGSGNKTAQFSVLLDGQPTDFDGQSLYFEAEGEYTFLVRLTDYIGTVKEFPYTIGVTINQIPVMVVGEFAPAYIAGYSYELPAAVATDWASQNGRPVDVPVRVTACYEGEQPFEVNGRFVPEKAGRVTLVYSAANAADEEKVARLKQQITVLDGKGISGLFLAENGAITATSAGAVFSSEGGGVFRFANPVDADVFSLNLQLYTAGSMRYDDFLAFGVTLYECGNRANAVTVRLSPADLGSAFRLGADAFAALAGKKVYVEFSFEGVSDTSAVFITQMCNQPFSDNPYDIIRPVITLLGNVPFEVQFGKIFTIPAASVFDVYDPNAVVYLTVYKPDGTLLCENAFIDEEIRVLADCYGTFNIDYIAYDHNGNSLPLSYAVTVIDSMPPVIGIEGSVPETGRVGSAIELPAAVAYDNHSENVQVFTFVLAPDGRLFEAEGSFVPETAGTYTVYYYACDEASNYVRETFTVAVEG